MYNCIYPESKGYWAQMSGRPICNNYNTLKSHHSQGSVRDHNIIEDGHTHARKSGVLLFTITFHSTHAYRKKKHSFICWCSQKSYSKNKCQTFPVNELVCN